MNRTQVSQLALAYCGVSQLASVRSEVFLVMPGAGTRAYRSPGQLELRKGVVYWAENYFQLPFEPQSSLLGLRRSLLQSLIQLAVLPNE